jgi:hypothetical protein
MTAALVGIGHFVLVRYVDNAGVERDALPERAGVWWFAWHGDPIKGSLVVVRADDGGAVSTDATRAAATHRRFHDAAPDRWLAATWSPPRGGIVIGQACAVRYRIPAGVRSNKAGDDWHHAFGDFGNGDDRSGDPQYRPALVKDRRGFLYFRRLRGNRYHLSDWMRA